MEAAKMEEISVFFRSLFSRDGALADEPASQKLGLPR